MICGIGEKKTSYLQIKKMRKKNHISEYHAPSPVGTMRKIREQSINEKPFNLVGYWGGKQKDLWGVIGEKTSLPSRILKRKTGRSQIRERSRTSLLA